MALVNKIRSGVNGFRNGANSKTLLALPSPIPKQSGHKLGSDEISYGGLTALIGASVSGLLGCATLSYCDEAANGTVCPYYPWPYRGVLSSSNTTLVSSGRRAFQDSCAACHANLSLVAKPCSDTVAKAVVTQIEVANVPIDKVGLMTETAMPKDQKPYSYTHKRLPRFANEGAYAPNITKILEVVRSIPYYSGGAISMRKMLSSCTMEYATPASVSQVALPRS